MSSILCAKFLNKKQEISTYSRQLIYCSSDPVYKSRALRSLISLATFNIKELKIEISWDGGLVLDTYSIVYPRDEGYGHKVLIMVLWPINTGGRKHT